MWRFRKHARSDRPRRLRGWALWGVVALGLLAPGCATLEPGAEGTSPIFAADPDDFERYQTLARRQERLLETCSVTGSCAYLHFSRGLVSLYEDRQEAARHFGRVVELVPDSRLAASSQVWVDLIADYQRPGFWERLVHYLHLSPEDADPLGPSTELLVRDLLEREIVIQQLLYKSKRNAATLEALKSKLTERGKQLEKLASQRRKLEDKIGNGKAPAIEQLEKQIAVRDKKIRELNNQLDALKRIDQEMRRKIRPVRPVPLPTPETP